MAECEPIPLNSLARGVPPAPVLRILARHSRAEIEGFIAVAIELLDLADGDPDLEDDDPHGVCDEDGINTAYMAACGGGPGCDMSDPGGCEHDGREPEDGE